MKPVYALIYSNNGLDVTKHYEGLQPVAYPDPASALAQVMRARKVSDYTKLPDWKEFDGKPWTVGYGHTSGVIPGDKVTEAEAARWLRSDIESAEKGVKKYVMVPLEQGQYDALVDFVFNVGESNFRQSSLLRDLNNGQYDKARDGLAQWRKAAGKVMSGLIGRRAAGMATWDGAPASAAIVAGDNAVKVYKASL